MSLTALAAMNPDSPEAGTQVRFVDLPVDTLNEPVWLPRADVRRLVGVKAFTLRKWIERGHVTERADGLLDLREVWAYAMRDTRGRH
jgi:hypothetical protein